MPREIKGIVIHCSDSTWGDVDVIRRWHTERGWSDIGYHGVILNGHRRAHGEYVAADDGLIEPGRSEELVGAHVRGHNSRTLGLCLIGKAEFTEAQMSSLISQVRAWMDRYDVPIEAVQGHYELDSHKTCPNLDMDQVRAMIGEVS